MIILGKDKVDERYNISDDGIITDLNGNEQKLYLHSDRWTFKSQKVHRILMWTKFGYRDTKVWAIHHKDHNHLNNNISNLEFISKSDHARMHMKGKQFSEETKKKMSIFQKNRIRKPFSEETKKKISESLKGHIPWNKGIKKDPN